MNFASNVVYSSSVMAETSRLQEVPSEKLEKAAKARTAYDATQVDWWESVEHFQQFSGTSIGCSLVSVWSGCSAFSWRFS